jgi:hypothetical protein
VRVAVVLTSALVMWTLTSAQTTSTVRTNGVSPTISTQHGLAPAQDSSLAVGQLSQQQGSQVQQPAARANCPTGYALAPTPGLNPSLIVCEVRKDVLNRCAALPGYYACGRNGTECCSKLANNSCFPGAYACASPGSLAAQARTACCLTR